MEKPSAQEPLLSNLLENKKPFLFVLTSVKWILKITIWGLFLFWACFLFLFPTELVQSGFQRWVRASQETVFGLNGSIFLLFSGPVLMIALLAVVYLILFGEEEHQENNGRKPPSFRLWTFPVLVNGPFGVVSAAEFIGIIVFFSFVIWAITVYTIHNLGRLPESPLPPELKSTIMLKLSGLRLGSIGLFCLAFLFLPIARGSVLLRLTDIPFEHASRYHVWLGHLTMLIFTLHGLFYVGAWIIEGHFIHAILEWRTIGIANLAGVISLIAGLLMWVTSLPPVRKQNFELFFYTHQLYIVFVVFLALHVGDFIFSMAAGGIFLFMLDRFLRFWQSRKTVDVISAMCLPCGTVELVLSKPPSLRYNALSFIFLQVRELSWLQWHPFSVSSSPLDGKYHLAILIKVLGRWTEKLREHITLGMQAQRNLPFQPHSKITASVEGPYGHESPYHLTYENLILVAGGIGISPFLAILRDIFHRIEEGKACLPQNILVVWAVKTSDELPLLSTDDMESICPFYTDKVNLEIQIFVTREVAPPLEEGKKLKDMKSSASPTASSGYAMSALVGTGDNIWSGMYVITSTVGLVILTALLNIYYINPFKISAWWYKGLLFLVCMVASVIIFGGFVVSLWNLWEGKLSAVKLEENLKQNEGVPNDEPLVSTNSWQENFASSTKYGCRPDFREIFESVSKRWGHVDIGVIVCGPPTLQSSVAKECRSQSLSRSSNRPIFHFNSHSFDL